MSEQETGRTLGVECEPPYTAVIFSSLRTDGDHGYAAAAEQMERLAAQQPGYLGIESARDPATGFGITVSYWRTAQDARAWKGIAEHERVQATGRRVWYRDYTVRIATVEREYRK
ncbi:antibiotic biosynthesis monooxygenase [Calidifontibacter sp. DB0510]|uniref:Antibiotic biosynthesis monooxygenase n=1 Tax=Metallococcus carri TaxID=1656884 RepID=A0A967AYE1_9MICO|nr:antibiotic biosynthesis monooxygenase [Metallococcus carri]NHN54998.1 antibiotic biosynthesis monooxygenase [Metallococcus carri]NOP37344.1 antibiotic biosynthesis monooxygenase [Calidifontibacter sp. DB2511S]